MLNKKTKTRLLQKVDSDLKFLREMENKSIQAWDLAKAQKLDAAIAILHEIKTRCTMRDKSGFIERISTSAKNAIAALEAKQQLNQ
jgi:transposase